MVWDARPLTTELREKLAVPREEATAVTGLVDTLFEKHLLQETVVEKLKSDSSLSESSRRKALEIASRRYTNPQQLNDRSWMIVRGPHESTDRYNEALRWAEAACRFVPESGMMLNTLGVAQYRAGKYADAAKTLARSNALNSKGEGTSHPADLVFLAMAKFRLGSLEAAKADLETTRQLVASNRWKTDSESIAFLREAEELIDSKKREPIEAVRPAPH
jgi:tetratricopeptide (TPR) repeat protein